MVVQKKTVRADQILHALLHAVGDVSVHTREVVPVQFVKSLRVVPDPRQKLLLVVGHARDDPLLR